VAKGDLRAVGEVPLIARLSSSSTSFQRLDIGSGTMPEASWEVWC
jgi:hypothetical protein